MAVSLGIGATGWLERLLDWHTDRILPVDAGIARQWGQLCGYLGYVNAHLLIAATTLEHGLTVVTGNVKHFEAAGVPVYNPFGGSDTD